MRVNRILLGTCPALAALCPGGARAAEAQRPNIVFILIDDMGSRDIGCYGSEFYETPNIDAWAAQSVRFSQAYASCHVSSPARGSLLTGLYPASNGITDWLPGRREYPFQRSSSPNIPQDLPHEIPNLAQTLHDAGYATAIVGKWHLGESGEKPTSYGFDLHIPDGYLRGWPDTYYYPFGMNGYNGEPGDYLTDKMTDEAIAYIRSQVGSDRPFFLFLSHFATHDPIQGRPDLVEKYRKKLADMPHGDQVPYVLEGNPDDPDYLSQEECLELLKDPIYQRHRIMPHNLVKVKQIQDNINFAAMVESVDESVGRVRATLDELNLTDNTIVIFFADNGGMSAANYGNPNKVFTDPDAAYSSSMLPFRGGKGWMYEGGLRVPLIIDWPGHGRHGFVCDTPVTTPDLYSTLVSMTGVSAPAGAGRDGVDLTPLLKGQKIKNRPIFWHFPHYSNHGLQSPCGAVRYGDWKLIEYYDRGTVQLFKLAKDISESRDLAKSKPGKVRKLKKMLSEWRVSVGAQMPSINESYDASIAASLYNDAVAVRFWPCAVEGTIHGIQGSELSFINGFVPSDAVESSLFDAISIATEYKHCGDEALRIKAESAFKEWNQKRQPLAANDRKALLWDILCATLFDISGHGRFLSFIPLQEKTSDIYHYWETIRASHIAGELNNNLEITGVSDGIILPGIKFGGGKIDISHSSDAHKTRVLLEKYTQPYLYKAYSIEVFVGFSAKNVSAFVNGEKIPASIGNRGFVSIRREWKQGDVLDIRSD